MYAASQPQCLIFGDIGPRKTRKYSINPSREGARGKLAIDGTKVALDVETSSACNAGAVPFGFGM